MSLGPSGRTPETDRRYWRRANRGVRKARRLRLLGKWSAVLAFNAAVLAALVYTGDRAIRHLTTTSELSLRTITVEGTHRSSEESIRSRLADLVGANLLEIDLDVVARRVRQEPWVDECAVRRVLPSGLHVAVNEREPVALKVVDGEVHAVDDTGRVVGPATAELWKRLPVFSWTVRLTESEQRERLRDGASALAALREAAPNWAGSIREIDLSRADRIGVITVASGPTIYLDPDRVDRNLNEYLALRDDIDDRIGHAEYVDLRWSNRIAVMPETEHGKQTNTEQR